MSYKKFPPDIDWVVIAMILAILALIAIVRLT